MPYDTTTGLQLWAPFESSVVDISGNARNGTAVASPTYATPGRIGSSIILNGSTQYVTFPALGIDNVSLCSLDFWIRIGTATAFSMPFSHGATDNARLEVFLDAAGTGIYCNCTQSANVSLEGRAASSVPLTATWYNIAVVLDWTALTSATRMRIWVNGVQKVLTFTVGSSGAPTATPNIAASNTTIGRRFYAGNLQFAGQVDEVRVYNTILSAGAIGDLAMVSGSAGLTKSGIKLTSLGLYE